jgi:hypothetical protein
LQGFCTPRLSRERVAADQEITMASPRDKSTPPSASDEKRSGRVAYDDRGNAIWEWQVNTGVYSRDVNTQSVRKLDLDELSLAETGLHRTLEIDEATVPGFNKGQAGGGFNPYDNAPAMPSRGPDPYQQARAASEKVFGRSDTPAPQSKKSPTDLRKLSTWIKLKRAISSRNEDDE